MFDGNRFPETGEPLSDPWVYLAEVEHRVVNEYAMMVSSLSIAASRASSAEARQTLLGAAHRLHELACVHRALQRPMTDRVDLFAYLRQFCDCVRRAGLDDRGLGINDGTSFTDVQNSYSTGTAVAGAGAYAGGFSGSGGGTNTNNYWNTTTSANSVASENPYGDSVATGLTTSQFQSGLPSGFSPGIWAENSAINGGLPYLIDNPPPK
jgi:hypothetical protein